MRGGTAPYQHWRCIRAGGLRDAGINGMKLPRRQHADIQQARRYQEAFPSGAKYFSK
jgi:hypothetical protein